MFEYTFKFNGIYILGYDSLKISKLLNFMPLLREKPDEEGLVSVVVRGKKIRLVMESRGAIVLDADKEVGESCVNRYYHTEKDLRKELGKLARNKKNRGKYFSPGEVSHQSTSRGKTILVLPYQAYRRV